MPIYIEVGYVEQSYHRAAPCFSLKTLRSIASVRCNRFLFSYYFECGRVSITRSADADRNKNRFQTFLLGFLLFFLFFPAKALEAHTSQPRNGRKIREVREREIWKANIRAAVAIRWIIVDNSTGCFIKAENLNLSRPYRKQHSIFINSASRE